MDIVDIILAKALAGGGGGGSGLPDASGQADNTALSVQSGSWAASGAVLPPISSEPEEILAEQSVNFSVQDDLYMGSVSGQYPINVGDNITVTWDGVSYDCVASEVNSFAAWGNLSIISAGNDTGEPFLMMYNPENGIIIGTLSGEVHTVSISGVSFTPPAGSILIVKDGEWTPTMLTKHPVSEVELTIMTAQSIPANTLVEINWNLFGSLPQGFSSGMLYGATFIKNGTIRPLLIIGKISNSPKMIQGYAMNLSSSAIFDTTPTLKGLLYV